MPLTEKEKAKKKLKLELIQVYNKFKAFIKEKVAPSQDKNQLMDEIGKLYYAISNADIEPRE